MMSYSSSTLSPLPCIGQDTYITTLIMTVPIKAPLWSLCSSLRPEQLSGQKESEKLIRCPFPLLLPLLPPAGQH